MFESMELDEVLYDREEVSRILGVTTGTLAIWACHKKKLPYIKIGRSVRYRRKDIYSFIEKNIKIVDNVD